MWYPSCSQADHQCDQKLWYYGTRIKYIVSSTCSCPSRVSIDISVLSGVSPLQLDLTSSCRMWLNSVAEQLWVAFREHNASALGSNMSAPFITFISSQCVHPPCLLILSNHSCSTRNHSAVGHLFHRQCDGVVKIQRK